MEITLISLTTIISGVTFLMSGFYIFLSWRKNKGEILLKTFTMFLLSMTFQMFFLTLGLAVFSDNPSMSNISWWIAHIFMMIATGNLLILPTRIKFPTKERLVKKIVILYVLIGGLILLLNLQNVELFRTPENIINWRVPALSSVVIAGYATVVSLFSVYVFLKESFKTQDTVMKYRLILLSLGILTFFVGGPMHNFISDVGIASIAASLSVFGVILILLGVYLPQISNQPPRENFPRARF